MCSIFDSNSSLKYPNLYKNIIFQVTIKIPSFNPKICLIVPNSDLYITVGINPILSDLQGSGTSKLGWRYLEHNEIDRNELQIRTNAQKGTGTKIEQF